MGLALVGSSMAWVWVGVERGYAVTRRGLVYVFLGQGPLPFLMCQGACQWRLR